MICEEVDHEDVMLDREKDVSKEEHGEFPNQKNAGVIEEYRRENRQGVVTPDQAERPTWSYYTGS